MSLKDYLSSLAEKRVTVIGAGVSNRPLIALLADAGISTTVCDKASAEALGDFYTKYSRKGIRFCLGETYLDDISADVIFRTPGMHPSHPALLKAVHSGARLTSEMEAFFSLCPSRIFAVTGSDGKTSTASMLAHILRTGGYRVWLGGNIGIPLLDKVDEMSAEDAVVLELSSFQLHSMYCQPDVAVITNLSPNHLDVHPDYADYVNAKKQILLHQRPDSRLVLNRENVDAAACEADAICEVSWFSSKSPVVTGVFRRKDGMICLVRGSDLTEILPCSDLLVPGAHNAENMMAAFAAAEGFVTPEKLAEAARSFTGVAHRLEIIRRHKGVTYINDSIATSPNRTIAGLSCFTGNVILIAGGKDKGLSFDELGEAVCRSAKALYLTGMTAEPIRRGVEGCEAYDPAKLPVYVMDDFKETVLAAANAADDGDIVLLSPASTSFDRFRNFEERGNAFRRIIEELE